MPYDEPHPDDPQELVAVSAPGDLESVREMAFTFAEEFAALGFGERRLLDLFRQPFYAGAHRAYRVLGETEIRRTIRQSLEVWGRFRVVVKEGGDRPSPAPAGTKRVGPRSSNAGEEIDR